MRTSTGTGDDGEDDLRDLHVHKDSRPRLHVMPTALDLLSGLALKRRQLRVAFGALISLLAELCAFEAKKKHVSLHADRHHLHFS